MNFANSMKAANIVSSFIIVLGFVVACNHLDQDWAREAFKWSMVAAGGWLLAKEVRGGTGQP